jgi:hypothetical protein
MLTNLQTLLTDIAKMRERMIKMTKAIVITISIIALFLAAVLFYYSNQLISPNNLDSYTARKEDMYLSQQKIEQSLSELNQTMALEIANQKVLTDKIIELSAKADLPPPVINTTRTVQEPPVIVRVPVPVTRAS